MEGPIYVLLEYCLTSYFDGNKFNNFGYDIGARKTRFSTILSGSCDVRESALKVLVSKKAVRSSQRSELRKVRGD